MKCPGQDTRYWKADAIFEVRCPNCGTLVEFFKDDTSRPCPGCGRRLPNPRLDFGCAAYCPYAEQCLGSLPPELREKQHLVFKDRLRAEVLARFQEDAALVERLLKRERFAEIIALEEGGRLAVVLAASYLLEWPEGALDLLKALHTPDDLREEILKALSGEEGLEAVILHDAQILTKRSLGEEVPLDLRTETGRRLAKGL